MLSIRSPRSRFGYLPFQLRPTHVLDMEQLALSGTNKTAGQS
jgi:hypothetical protein